MVNSLKEKVYEEGVEQQNRNKLLIADNQDLEDIITDKKEQLADLQEALDKVNATIDRADKELTRAKEELAEVRKLRNELITHGDGGGYYLKEEVIQLRYENQNLKAENKGLREKLDKAYEFMKQFMIEGRSMLDKFFEWIGEKVRNVRGR